jgi:hypothetical protein
VSVFRYFTFCPQKQNKEKEKPHQLEVIFSYGGRLCDKVQVCLSLTVQLVLCSRERYSTTKRLSTTTEDKQHPGYLKKI